MNITLELVRDEWDACYSAERLAALYDRPHTPLEVLTRDDGEWATVPARDRLWTVLRKDMLPDRTLRLFACECATRALNRERAAGREPDARSWNAVDVARRHAEGQASDQELTAARDAAWDAARAAARDAAWAAAWDAARDAARDAAWDAAWAAAQAAAWAAAWAAAQAAAQAAAWDAAQAAAQAAAWDAARATETSEQLKILVAMLRGSDATTEASVRA